MPALVENMMYVSNAQNGRFVPWHGLGVAVEEAPNSSEALTLAGLDWKVNSEPIYTSDNLAIPGYKANVRDKDNSVLGVVSDRYRIVQNTEAFEFTDNLLGEGVKYETAGSLRNGKTIWLLAKMDNIKIAGDDVTPYLCFTNSHDGKGAIQVCQTPIRIVCSNTLNIALSTAERSWTCKHMGDMKSKLDEARTTLHLVNKYNNELSLTADKLANTKIQDWEIEKVLDELFPTTNEDSDRKIKNVREMKDEFTMCYISPDIAKFRGTAWGVVNAMADLVCHKAPNRETKNYQENNWYRIINGHPIMDAFNSKVFALKNIS